MNMELILRIFLISAGSFVISWFLYEFIIFLVIFHRKKEKSLDEVDLSETHYAPYVDKLYTAMARMKEEPYEELSISSFGTVLKANYYSGNSSKTVIFIHGYRATPFNNFSVAASMFLDEGYNVVLVYQRAHGKSGGKFSTMGVREHEDLLRWIEHIDKLKSPEKIYIYGMSMGGTTVSFASDKIQNPKVKALVVDCGFSNFKEMLMSDFKNRHVSYVWSGTMLPLYAKFFLHATITKNAEDSLKFTKLPVLFLHGFDDTMVSAAFSKKHYEICSSEKNLILVKGAGHTASLLVGGQKVLVQITDFFEKVENNAN